MSKSYQTSQKTVSGSTNKLENDNSVLNNLRRELSEKEILLSLNNDIATVRNRKDILKVIHPKLKRLFNTEDIFICILDKEKETLNPFLRVGSERRINYPEYETTINSNFPIHDGFIDSILEEGNSLVFDIDEVNKWTTAPGYMKISKDAGLEETLSKSLRYADEVIGIITLWSETKNSFTSHHKKLMESIADQISIVIINILANEEIQQRDKEKEILLTVSKELNSIRNKEELLPLLKKQFEQLSFYSDVTIAKVDADNQTFSAFIVNEESNRPNHPGYEQVRDAHRSFPDGVFEVALNSQKPVVFDIKELANRPNALPYIKFLYENGTIEMVGVSLRDRNKEIAALFLFSDRKLSFSELQLSLVQGIGNQLGTIVANILANEEIKKNEYEKSILLSFSNEIASVRNKIDLFGVMNSRLKEMFLIEGFAIAIINEDGKTHGAFLLDLEDTIKNHTDFNDIISEKYNVTDGIFDTIMESNDPVLIKVNELSDGLQTPVYALFWKKLGIPLIIGVPLRVGENNLGCLFFHIKPDSIRMLRNNLLKGVCAQISISLSNILANEKIAAQLNEINQYKEQLEEEKQYLQQEISSGYTYSDIIGNGPEMQKIFHQLSQVAFANSTVLILGETGTGKELVARAIHNLSPRKDKLMVKVNCAVLPANLIESELFGHERGSFTGAMERRIGKFELANHGTLFLDEIGEMPFDLQVKLLRALQEKEIERVGGKATIKVDVRIIAATNRNLQKEVDEGRFRSDLFYRLNVFPMTLPPLRERKEDIPVLVKHFIEKFSKNTGKGIRNISAKAMKELIAYTWPGNVRELEHLVERSILTNTGTTIKEMNLPNINRKELKESLQEDYLKTYDENEREHIILVLNKCKGKIFGSGGAAEILGLRVSTLNSKMKKLGIKKNKLYN